MKRILMMAATGVLGLTACTTKPMTPDEYMKFCTNRVKYWDMTFKNELQNYMGTTREKMPEVFCRRVMGGLQSGRITMKDLIEMHDKSSSVWPVIKGK